MDNGKKLYMVSLGCSKNQVDSEVMLGRLPEFSITQDLGDADVIIVNTCGFIGPAKEESIRTTLELHEGRKDGSLLVMAGCLSERYKEELSAELPEVDIFTGVGDYAKIDELLAAKSSRFTPSVYLLGDEERVITGSTYHAYIKMAEGCNQTCSFCAIPGFKGKLASRPVDQIVHEVQRLASRGFYDFSFVSQDSSSYGRDHGDTQGLITLMKAVEASSLPSSSYGRILYLYPTTTTPEMIDHIAQSPFFVPYFDMPIQHISDAMLKTMKRGAGRQKIESLLQAMRAVPHSFVRTSVIVGHPGESDEIFNELCEFLETFPFDRVNVFAYSDEEGTSAFDMEDKVSQKVINQRLKKIEKIIAKQTKKRLEGYTGQTLQAVVNGSSEETELLLSAKAKLWAPDIDGEILINDSDVTPELGKLGSVTITGLAGDKLLGTLITL